MTDNIETLDKKALEEKRREARKNRIQNNLKNRIGFISDHVEELNNVQETDNEIKSSNDNTNNKTDTGFNLENIMKKKRYLKEPFSFKAGRFIGAFFFSIILIAMTILYYSKQLLLELTALQLQSDREILRIFILLITSQRGKLLFFTALGFTWLLWEGILVYSNESYTKAVTKSPLVSYLRRDILILGFFYTIGIDISLRYISENYKSYNMDNQLSNGLYLPLLIAAISQIVINQIPKYIDILNNDLFNKFYKAAFHIVSVLAILILCIDDWSCASSFCQNGFLWLLTYKSKGLMLWSHICLNFVSELLN